MQLRYLKQAYYFVSGDDEQTAPVNLSQETNEPTPGPSAIALEREEKKEPEAEAEQK